MRVVASRAMPIQEAPIPPRLARRLERWLRRWGTPSLVRSLRIEWSPRLRRAFGRCYQDERLIRLTPSLLDRQSHLLPEILCHEAAHAAVYQLHGPTARPHGAEWEELMRLAGFEPRVRIPVAVHNSTRRLASDRVVYLHRCPSCDLARRASRPMPLWRCRTCTGTRSGGRLVIRREAARRTSGKRGSAANRDRQRRSAAASQRSRRRRTTTARKSASGKRR